MTVKTIRDELDSQMPVQILPTDGPYTQSSLHFFLTCVNAVRQKHDFAIIPEDMSHVPLFFFLFFFLLSHQLCRPQRHCSRATRPGTPHLRPHPGLIPHRGPTPRGPQEVMSDRW